MKKVILLPILLIILAMIAFVGLGLLCSSGIRVTSYTQALDGVQGDVKLVFLSDLHCRQFGRDNESLIALVQAQSPDLIALPGDIIDRGSSDAQIEAACAFVAQLAQLAPTYLTLGNHEVDYISQNGDALRSRFRATGATLLECDYEDLSINGTALRLGGMSELAYYGGDGKYDPKAEPFLREYCETSLPKVMLSHRPEAFCFKYACQDWDVDLILSGHTHGGLVRLPLIGGVVAPIQGFFPDVDYGEFQFYDTKMIVTSGLAGYEGIPRLFNPPELCVVTLTSKG